MPIHEKSLIDPNQVLSAEKLVIEGVDVSGHWNTMILPRTVADYFRAALRIADPERFDAP